MLIKLRQNRYLYYQPSGLCRLTRNVRKKKKKKEYYCFENNTVCSNGMGFELKTISSSGKPLLKLRAQ